MSLLSEPDSSPSEGGDSFFLDSFCSVLGPWDSFVSGFEPSEGKMIERKHEPAATYHLNLKVLWLVPGLAAKERCNPHGCSTERSFKPSKPFSSQWAERRSEDLEPFLSEVWAKDLSKPCHLYVT